MLRKMTTGGMVIKTAEGEVNKKADIKEGEWTLRCL